MNTYIINFITLTTIFCINSMLCVIFREGVLAENGTQERVVPEKMSSWEFLVLVFNYYQVIFFHFGFI